MNNDEMRRRLRRLREERQMRVNGGAAGFANSVTRMSNANIAREIANLEAALPRRRRTPVKRKRHTKSERWEEAAKRRNAELERALEEGYPSQLGLEKYKNKTANYRNKARKATFPRTRYPPQKRRRLGVSRSASSSNSKNSANNLKKGFNEANLETMANVADVRRRQLVPPRTALSGVSHNSQNSERARARSRSSSRSRGSSVGSRSRSSPGSRTPSNSNSNASRPPSRA